MANYAGDVSYLAGALREQIQAEAIVRYAIAGVTRKLVSIANGSPGAQTISFDKVNMGTNVINSADISARTDSTTAVTATVINTDKATITPALYPVAVHQYDRVAMSSAHDPAIYWGGLIANALAAKVDNLLNALFDGFTTNTEGTSTVGVTVDNLLEALKDLKAYNAPGVPAWVAPAGNIWGEYGIMSEVISTAAIAGVQTQDEVLRNAFIGRIAGLNLYHSEEFTESSNATKSGIFVPQALGYGYVEWPGGSEIRVEVQREADQFLTKWIGAFFGGVIEIYDPYGVELHTKTS